MLQNESSNPSHSMDAPSYLYVGDYDNCLYAFQIRDGARLWKVCTKGRLESSPDVVVLPGETVETVFVGSGDGYVYAFYGKDGTQRWSTKLGPPVGTFTATGGVGSTPNVLGEVVYVGGPDSLWALDAKTGSVLWRFETPSKKMVGSSPIVTDDGKAIVVGSEGGFVYKLRL